MDDVITLISRTFTKDDYGIDTATEKERDVFAKVESITRAEFFDGGRNGLNPEFKFIVFAGDYSGEVVVSYKSKRYSIYRSYQTSGSDYIELYAERKGGTNG